MTRTAVLTARRGDLVARLVEARAAGEDVLVDELEHELARRRYRAAGRR